VVVSSNLTAPTSFHSFRQPAASPNTIGGKE